MWEWLAVLMLSCCSTTLSRGVVVVLLRGHGSAKPLLQLLVEPGQPQSCLGIAARSVEIVVCGGYHLGFCGKGSNAGHADSASFLETVNMCRDRG